MHNDFVTCCDVIKRTINRSKTNTCDRLTVPHQPRPVVYDTCDGVVCINQMNYRVLFIKLNTTDMITILNYYLCNFRLRKKQSP
jgi:hypothetical protein